MAASKAGRVCRAVVAALTACGVAAAGASCAPFSKGYSAKYCAIMPDSIGLYVGNYVTQMGYPIGTIKAISPDTTNVRVEFTITEDRKFPSDVKAVTRSASLLADRSLELVGNYDSGPSLPVGGCIPLSRSSTPKSLSQVVGSATDLINAIAPEGSTSVGDVVQGVDKLLHNNGVGINQLLRTSSALTQDPDAAISDIGPIIVNLAQLTSSIRQDAEPYKQVLIDLEQDGPTMVNVFQGAGNLIAPLGKLSPAAIDLELRAGDNIQTILDTSAALMRKFSPHATWLGDFLLPVPAWINIAANWVNRRQFSIRYRPPLYRIRTPDGLLTCGTMNAAAPGSCMDVAGQPYAVDVALLQYVLTEASRR